MRFLLFNFSSCYVTGINSNYTQTIFTYPIGLIPLSTHTYESRTLFQDVLAVLGDSLAYTFALCLPSPCSPATLAHSLAEVADDVNYYLASANLTVQFSVEETDCHVKQRPPLNTVEVLGM